MSNLFMLSAILAAPSLGQVASGSAGALAGRVLDAATGLPVAEALVTFEVAPSGVMLDARASGVMVSVRSMLTGEGGAYRFSDVAPGRYRLRIERLGYRAATVEVEIRQPVTASVSVGLELEPVELEPLLVEQRAASLFQRAANRVAELDEARIASERVRQALFLTPDARTLTYADVIDGVTLGEGDVFRALQRFPGVGTRDDYTAELWTRGAPWTHTRVTFDGVPLFNPVHAVGILSAITPEVLGAVFFHPGVRPAGVAGGSAGVVDLRSRPGGGDGEVRGVLDLSVATAKVAFDQRLGDRASWVLAARRSHLDVMNSGVSWIGLDSVDLPYVFHDVAGRLDLRLSGSARIEASGLWEEDRLNGDVTGLLERTRASWGNTAGRVTLRTAVGSRELSHTVGLSRFHVGTDERLVRTWEDTPSWTEPDSRNDIRHLHFAGELAAGPGEGPVPWSLGYDIAWQRGDYEGPLPRYNAVKPDTTHTVRYKDRLLVAGFWGDARVAVADWLTLNPGVRVEAGDAVKGAPGIRVAPRLAARFALSPDQSISVAVGRSWQYIQAIALGGPSIHPAFHASHFWVSADKDSPAIRADIASLGAERWLGGGWLASGTVFVRRATGVTVPPPEPGPLAVVRRPVFVAGENLAGGFEAGLRRIGASWSASLGYSWGASALEAGGWRYPSPADRRHMVDAMLGVRVLSALRFTGAYTSMSGAPFTRAVVLSPEDCTYFAFGCGQPTGSNVREPNAERTPAYQSLDVSVQWARTFGRVQLSTYLQVKNVLDHDNGSTYSGTVRSERALPSGAKIIWDDRFESGLPRMPLFGVRVTF